MGLWNYFQQNQADSKASEEPQQQGRRYLISINDLNEKYVRTFGFLSVTCLILYFLLSVLASHLWFGFNRLDAVYYSVITFTTVGYGDFVPHTHPQQLFVAFLIILGVGVGSSLIGTLNDIVSTHAQKMAEQRSIRTAKELSLVPAEEQSDGRSSESPQSHHILRSGISSLRVSVPNSNFNMSTEAQHGPVDSHAMSLHRMEKIYTKAYQEDFRELRSSVIINIAVVIALVVIGAVGMSVIEGWSAKVAIYWACVTISSVGYGDYVPKTDTGKVFTIIYVLTGVAFMAKTLVQVVQFPMLLRARKNELKVLNQFGSELSKEMLQEIFTSHFFDLFPHMRQKQSEMSKTEFCLLVLHLMNKVEAKDLLVASRLFDSLDHRGEGYLTTEEIDSNIRQASTEQELKRTNSINSESSGSSWLGKMAGAVSGKSQSTPKGDSLYQASIKSPLMANDLFADNYSSTAGRRQDTWHDEQPGGPLSDMSSSSSTRFSLPVEAGKQQSDERPVLKDDETPDDLL